MTTPEGSISEQTALLNTSRQEEGKLLSYEESLRLLPWQTDNEYVRSGYRNQLGSVKACLWSTIACESNESLMKSADEADVHNETGTILAVKMS
jgi:adiponectin receptor